jgi:hypothetical protein
MHVGHRMLQRPGMIGFPTAFLLVSCSAYSTLKTERYVPPAHLLTFSGLHSFIFQNTLSDEGYFGNFETVFTKENLRNMVIEQSIS